MNTRRVVPTPAADGRRLDRCLHVRAYRRQGSMGPAAGYPATQAAPVRHLLSRIRPFGGRCRGAADAAGCSADCCAAHRACCASAIAQSEDALIGGRHSACRLERVRHGSAEAEGQRGPDSPATAYIGCTHRLRAPGRECP